MTFSPENKTFVILVSIQHKHSLCFQIFIKRHKVPELGRNQSNISLQDYVRQALTSMQAFLPKTHFLCNFSLFFWPYFSSFLLQIATKLIKILTKILEKAQYGDSNWTKNYSHWLRCLDMLMTINTYLLGSFV